MIANVEELRVKPQLHTLRYGEPVREIEIAPIKFGPRKSLRLESPR